MGVKNKELTSASVGEIVEIPVELPKGPLGCAMHQSAVL